MRQLVIRRIKDRDWRCQVFGNLVLAWMIALVVCGRIIMAKSPTKVRLVVYAFSTQEEVLTQEIFPAFKQVWEAQTGQDLTIEGVFGPSAMLAGQINLGAPADVALFSNAQHVAHLKVGRKVRVNNEPVVVSHAPMVIVTRPGNPHGITGFSDLARPGLQLLHADPRTSGAGQWAILAEYGSALPEMGDQTAALPQNAGAARLVQRVSEKAQTQLQAIWQNVRLLGTSARATMTLFEMGAGDAFVTYEHDALLAQERGALLEIVVPSQTIVARHVAVMVDANVTPAELPLAQAFVEYLLSDAGQRAFSHYHLQPADLDGEPLPETPLLFTIDDLGGWSWAYTQLVEGLWQTKIEPHLHLESIPRVLGTGE